MFPSSSVFSCELFQTCATGLSKTQTRVTAGFIQPLLLLILSMQYKTKQTNKNPEGSLLASCVLIPFPFFLSHLEMVCSGLLRAKMGVSSASVKLDEASWASLVSSPKKQHSWTMHMAVIPDLGAVGLSVSSGVFWKLVSTHQALPFLLYVLLRDSHFLVQLDDGIRSLSWGHCLRPLIVLPRHLVSFWLCPFFTIIICGFQKFLRHGPRIFSSSQDSALSLFLVYFLATSLSTPALHILFLLFFHLGKLSLLWAGSILRNNIIPGKKWRESGLRVKGSIRQSCRLEPYWCWAFGVCQVRQDSSMLNSSQSFEISREKHLANAGERRAQHS